VATGLAGRVATLSVATLAWVVVAALPLAG
jgi:hypothetical protein